MAELAFGILIIAAVGAFVADRYGEGPREVIAVLVLVALDLVMMAGLLGVATAENSDSGGGWECSSATAIALALGIPAVTFAIGFLLVRALGRGS